MKEITYKLGELKSLIRESSQQEFKPKMGSNVESENKAINDKSYKEVEKKVDAYNGGLTETEKDKVVRVDDNKTTLDAKFDNKVPKDYKDRIKAQAEGYTSVAEKENGIEKNADFEKNEEIYDMLKDADAINSEDTLALKKSGLSAREMEDETFKKDSMYENKNIKRLNFKHTTFLTENHMISRIPEEYKVNGVKFIMKDAVDNEYLIEWVVDSKNNVSEAKVIQHTNKTKLNEEMSRIKSLFNYKSSDYCVKTNPQTRLAEEKEFGKFIEGVKKINK